MLCNYPVEVSYEAGVKKYMEVFLKNKKRRMTKKEITVRGVDFVAVVRRVAEEHAKTHQRLWKRYERGRGEQFVCARTWVRACLRACRRVRACVRGTCEDGESAAYLMVHLLCQSQIVSVIL